jgi:imidazolonepropionase-like amidohydrolase
LITMRGDEVIAHGDILIRDNRIVALGRSGTLGPAADARVIDLTGTTVMPGMVDLHAHMSPSWGVHRTRAYEYEALLAYGITTAHDPQTFTSDFLTYADLVRAGAMVGPRISATGPGVFGGADEDIESLDDAMDLVSTYSELYGVHHLKDYTSRRREVHAWLAQAAREQGITPTSHVDGVNVTGGLVLMLEGFSGKEHAIDPVPMYRDWFTLIARSGIAITPTLLADPGAPADIVVGGPDPLVDTKLRRFVPPSFLPQQVQGHAEAGLEAIAPRYPAQMHDILRAGGLLAVGGHGRLQGMGTHQELWAMASGGMRPIDAIRCATLAGAQALGYDRDLGSLEPGKLADLIVLNSNPLDDLHRTVDIRYVVKNGRIYDATTLDEEWPRRVVLEPPPWEKAIVGGSVGGVPPTGGQH